MFSHSSAAPEDCDLEGDGAGDIVSGIEASVHLLEPFEVDVVVQSMDVSRADMTMDVHLKVSEYV